jgi:hypothetical protein
VRSANSIPVSGRLECSTYASHYAALIVTELAGAYANDRPALCGKKFQPHDVVCVFCRIRPVLLTVILDAHHPLRLAHVDSSDDSAPPVRDRDLSHWPRQSISHKKQP